MGKIILTGDRPTGRLHVGHYVGSLRNRVILQNSGKFEKLFFMIADAQALTDNFDNPGKVRENIMQVALDYMACGLDPRKCHMFIQSVVCELTELTFYYMNLVTLARLERNPTVKAEIQLRGFNHSIPMGFLTYPVSQTADITAFMADTVPVGEDQKQHVEICCDIADRFNYFFPDTFTRPEPLIPTTGKRIMSLADPTKKMSKSDENPNGVVYILDDKDTIIRKFRRAVTDSDTEVRFAEGKDGVNNLMTVYSAFTGKNMEEIEREFAGKGYGDLKTATGEVTADALAPVQKRFAELLADKAGLEAMMKKGADTAAYFAQKTLSKVQRKLGFVARPR